MFGFLNIQVVSKSFLGCTFFLFYKLYEGHVKIFDAWEGQMNHLEGSFNSLYDDDVDILLYAKGGPIGRHQLLCEWLLVGYSI